MTRGRRFLAEGGEISSSTPEAFATFLRGAAVKWAQVIRRAGVTAE